MEEYTKGVAFLSKKQYLGKGLDAWGNIATYFNADSSKIFE